MKRKTLLFLIFIISVSLKAQTIFGPQNVIISEELSVFGTTNVFPIDIDSDGDLDVVSSSIEDNKIAWFENMDGEGDFSDHKIITNLVEDARAIYAIDLDNDGDVDVLSASSNDDKIAWYENEDGLGTFGDQIIISEEAENVRSIVCADIDNDGNMDVISALLSDKLMWYKNVDNLGPSFDTSYVISVEVDNPRSIYAADLDNDGDVDILSASQTDDKIAWYENEDGLGGFGDQQIISTLADGAISVYAGDLDNDGDIDVLSASSNDDKLAWYENEDGMGSFGNQQIISIEENGVNTVYAADVDNDGDLDVFCSAEFGFHVSWYENLDGLGNFGDQQIISHQEKHANDVHVVDLNGDGKLDVLSSAYTNQIAWFENENGLGLFEGRNLISYQVTSVRSVYSADLDGDGDQDVLSGSFDDFKLAWYENLDGNGEFGDQIIINNESIKVGVVYSADLDGDGDQDVLSTGFGRVSWYENQDGFGGFGSEKIVSTDDAYPILKIGDIDDDGDLDILYSSFSYGTIAWFENQDGLGNFGPAQELTPFAELVESIFLVDMDEDGDLDVLANDTGSGKIGWFENEDGQGNFGPQQLTNINLLFSHAYPTDIDNDGDCDIVALYEEGGELRLYKNDDGQGTFDNGTVIEWQLNEPRDIICEDFDNDGDIDILIAIKDDNSIAWYQNIDGQGTFGEKTIISNQTKGVFDIHISDLNGDGIMDVLSASDADHKVAWYQNLLNAPVISGYCFFDENENQIKDANEVGLLNQSVNVEPSAILNFTNDEGFYQFYVEQGNYTITPQLSGDWQLTTDSSSYSLNVQGTTIQNINFGLKPVEEIIAVEATQSSAATRCGFKVPFWINYENTGTTFTSGQVSLEIDPLCTLVEAEPNPDLIQGNTLYWNYENLAPSYSDGIDLVLQMPGVDHLGETVAFTTTTFIEDDLGNLVEYTSYEYFSQINCSYDPNDKLVHPEGEQEENYTLFGEELEYTIRFQNTGTDTAFTIRIEDQLDDNLDWSSFRPVSASHSYVANLYENGIAEFLFENILLPDSTTHEVASHGFVKYRIKPLEGLSENTEIQNTADIFFDFNLAIQTNTTLNTLVSEIPVGVKETEQLIEIEVFPNPFEGFTTIRIGDIPGRSKAELKIYDVNGRLMNKYDVGSNSKNNVGRRLNPGIYFYELKINNEEILACGKMIKLRF